MAEQEVIKHTKKVFKIWKSNQNGFWYKLKEFLFEIFIIVFAVSLSIWFHDLSTKMHQKEEVRDFYIDLKSDLENDKKEFEDYKKNLTNGIGSKNKASDTIKLDVKRIARTNTTLNLLTIYRKNNKGNFESFKSSGNTSFIQNKLLKRMIFTYYEQSLKKIESIEETCNAQGDKTLNYILQNKKENMTLIYSNSVMYKNYLGMLLNKYNETILEINVLLSEIDKELKQ